MTLAPRLRAEARVSRRYASVGGRLLTFLGIAVFALLALYGIGWTLLGVVSIAAFVLVELRVARSVWALDPPGPDAAFGFGAGASRAVPIADIAGVVVQHAGGASSRGIPITRAHERWWLVDRDNRVLASASTEGLAAADVDAFRAALGVPFAPLSILRRSGELPSGLPLHARRPGATLVLAVLIAIAVMVAVLAAPPYPW
ncbi:hypothetical protein L332_10880 [Agrococcus pavilionensis RW1]|uniref:Uncharacterized protein n=1 Tax=Agrococcus pavilionensis RW1 TaxID=1330458 RepID=U1MWF9_9MICO|nr:hypothetical protein [Agrococcus pavilionensis]ERG64945.1 hypothetical protein L332_10880 [Agrococcus pavilionensis RW1]